MIGAAGGTACPTSPGPEFKLKYHQKKKKKKLSFFDCPLVFTTYIQSVLPHCISLTPHFVCAAQVPN
jgi:hypothetical protein